MPVNASLSVGMVAGGLQHIDRRQSPAPPPPDDCESPAMRGLTTTSRAKPIVFTARAAAPMLPGWLGATSTKRTRSGTGSARFEVGATRCSPSLMPRSLSTLPSHAPNAQHGHQGGTQGRLDHQSRQPRHRSRAGRATRGAATSSPKLTGRRSRRSSRSCATRTRTTASSRRNRARAIRGRRRIHVDHRSARWHDQLHPRLSAVRGVDRAPASRPAHSGGRLRPHAQRAVHRLEGARRIPQRSAPARLEAACSCASA